MEFTIAHEKDGKWVVEDIRYKPYGPPDLRAGYSVYVGETILGLALGPRRFEGWWGIPWNHSKDRTVKGFISRRKAVEYMLVIEGYWKEDN